MLEKSQHEHEMEQLKREKEEALAEEIKITKAGKCRLGEEGGSMNGKRAQVQEGNKAH